MQHDLKILPLYFLDVACGVKNFELRKDDRNYTEGDGLCLREWTPEAGFSGRYIIAKITYILRNCPEYGLTNGFCILGFNKTFEHLRYEEPKEFLPCPFCGGENIKICNEEDVRSPGVIWHYCECQDCKALTAAHLRTKAAADAWNRRTKK